MVLMKDATLYIRLPHYLHERVQLEARKRGMRTAEYIRHMLINMYGEPVDEKVGGQGKEASGE